MLNSAAAPVSCLLLQEAEEKVAFLYQRFVQAANRCKVLEKTCRGLLEASVSTNDHNLSNVNSMVGTVITPPPAAAIGARVPNVHQERPVHHAPVTSGMESIEPLDRTRYSTPNIAAGSYTGQTKYSLDAAKYYEKRKQVANEMAGSAEPESRASQAMHKIRSGPQRYPLPSQYQPGVQTYAASSQQPPTGSVPSHSQYASLPSTKAQHATAPGVPTPPYSHTQPSPAASSSHYGQGIARSTQYPPSPTAPNAVARQTLYPRPLPPTDSFLQLLRRQRQQTSPSSRSDA